jgi:hypothetical protein
VKKLTVTSHQELEKNPPNTSRNRPEEMNVKKPIQYPPAIILYGNLGYGVDSHGGSIGSRTPTSEINSCSAYFGPRYQSRMLPKIKIPPKLLAENPTLALTTHKRTDQTMSSTENAP